MSHRVRPVFHSNSENLYFLFESFPLSSTPSLFLAYAALFFMGLTERLLSHWSEGEHTAKKGGLINLFCKMLLYAFLVILRYFIMLMAMSFHSGIVSVVILATVSGQALVELVKIIKPTEKTDLRYVRLDSLASLSTTPDDPKDGGGESYSLGTPPVYRRL